METNHPEGEAPSTDTTLYSRCLQVDEETFEGDLLLMHPEKQTVVTLNPAAAVLWEALQWPLSSQDLADLLTEAHPELPPDSALVKVRETLKLLEEHGFIAPAKA